MHPTLFFPSVFQLAAVTELLAIVPLISENLPSQPSRSGLHFRGAVARQSVVLPAGWVEQSCFTDDPEQRTLTSTSITDQAMTVELCVNTCNDHYLAYAGLENGQECYCGNVTTDGAAPTSSSNCGTSCFGNNSEFCGGPNSLSLYWNGRPRQPDPTFVQTVGVGPFAWNFEGCFRDPNDAMAQPVNTSLIGGKYHNSVERCGEACEGTGYSIAGMKSALECWCANSLSLIRGSTTIDEKSCMLACPGNSLQFCGGANGIVIYSRAYTIWARASHGKAEEQWLLRCNPRRLFVDDLCTVPMFFPPIFIVFTQYSNRRGHYTLVDSNMTTTDGHSSRGTD